MVALGSCTRHFVSALALHHPYCVPLDLNELTGCCVRYCLLLLSRRCAAMRRRGRMICGSTSRGTAA